MRTVCSDRVWASCKPSVGSFRPVGLTFTLSMLLNGCFATLLQQRATASSAAVHGVLSISSSIGRAGALAARGVPFRTAACARAEDSRSDLEFLPLVRLFGGPPHLDSCYFCALWPRNASLSRLCLQRDTDTCFFPFLSSLLS